MADVAAIESIDRQDDGEAACETPVSNNDVEAEQQLFQSENVSLSQAELVPNSFCEALTRSSRRRSGSSLSSSISSLRMTRKSSDIACRAMLIQPSCAFTTLTLISPPNPNPK